MAPLSLTLKCAIDGCDSNFYARGFCVMHYDRFRSTGDPGPAARRHRRWGEGGICKGYRVLRRPGHPLARAQHKVYEHRLVLWEHIGPGLHSCHWCGTSVAWMPDHGEELLFVDHLDDDKLNNAPQNLVPSCRACNTNRGQ